MMSAVTRRSFAGSVACLSALVAMPGRVLASENAGRFLEYREISAGGLPAQRLTIWLPPGYDKANRNYRVLYMHDAQNLFDPALSNFNKVWAADQAMLRHASKNDEDPWIIVGIWSPGVDRYRQYLPLPTYEASSGALRTDIESYAQGPIVSHHYLEWIVTELKPWVDNMLRTRPGQGDTAIIGSSMGGLISLYAFLEHPEVFGRAGCVSTHWPVIAPQSVGSTDPSLIKIWESLISEKLGEARGRKVWFDHGTATLDAFYPPYQARIDSLMERLNWERGSEWESRAYPGAEHEENAWAQRLPEVFDWVLA